MPPKFLKKIRNLPTLPSILSKIIATLDDPNSSAAELEKIIRHDQALTTKLLAVANSAYYGFRHQITTVGRAVVAVGYNEVRNLCMGLSLMGFLHPSTFKNSRQASQLWLHSLAVSEAAKVLAKGTGAAEADIAFTAGLLHDVGKVVLAAFYPDDVDKLTRTMAEKEIPFLEAERELEMSHERVGRALADHWELPPAMVEVISRHHTPAPSQDYFGLVSSVHVADYLCHRLGFNDMYRNGLPELKDQGLAGLRLEKTDLVRYTKDIHNQRESIFKLWEQMVGTSRNEAPNGQAG